MGIETGEETFELSKGAQRMSATTRSRSKPFMHRTDDVEDACQRDVEAPTAAASKLIHGEKERKGTRTWLRLEDISGSQDSSDGHGEGKSTWSG